MTLTGAGCSSKALVAVVGALVTLGLTDAPVMAELPKAPEARPTNTQAYQEELARQQAEKDRRARAARPRAEIEQRLREADPALLDLLEKCTFPQDWQSMDSLFARVMHEQGSVRGLLAEKRGALPGKESELDGLERELSQLEDRSQQLERSRQELERMIPEFERLLARAESDRQAVESAMPELVRAVEEQRQRVSVARAAFLRRYRESIRDHAGVINVGGMMEPPLPATPSTRLQPRLDAAHEAVTQTVSHDQRPDDTAETVSGESSTQGRVQHEAPRAEPKDPVERLIVHVKGLMETNRELERVESKRAGLDGQIASTRHEISAAGARLNERERELRESRGQQLEDKAKSAKQEIEHAWSKVEEWLADAFRGVAEEGYWMLLSKAIDRAAGGGPPSLGAVVEWVGRDVPDVLERFERVPQLVSDLFSGKLDATTQAELESLASVHESETTELTTSIWVDLPSELELSERLRKMIQKQRERMPWSKSG